MKITGRVFGSSLEALRPAFEFARRATNPDEVLTRTFVSFPGGVVKQERTEHLRFGDYFDSVELTMGESTDAPSFTITWDVKEGVASSWKDIVVKTVSDIEAKHPTVKTSLKRDRLHKEDNK